MANETINWYPGHMKKATRMMEDSLRLVDAVVELRDARIPNSSRNPDVERIVGSKPRLIVLNRADQADAAATALWKKALTGEGALALEMDCKSGRGVNAFPAAARSLLKEKIERAEAKGQVGKALRFMVLGVPNVGKSSFINRLAGRKAAETSDRPGVTRGKQWITLNGGILLLDTPGILWPKFESPEVGYSLAWTGAINDNILDVELVACRLLERLRELYPGAIEARYKFTPDPEAPGYELLEAAARKRGFLISGGEVNTERMAHVLLDEFREGKLGRGPLAGPVCAAAVLLPEGLVIPGLNDSKKLTAKKRDALYDIICESAVAFGIAFATVDEIEALNIKGATYLAMNRAIADMEPAPILALVDGNDKNELDIPAIKVVKGDSLCASIAAASVLAKVTRDRYMDDMDALYPQYGFARHKGYGTAAHYAALREYGPSPIHRPTYLRKMH